MLTRALAKLPERQRSVFMLSHYEGCTSREVSAMTGLNESTVRVHLFRAIRKLRVLLADADRAGVPWRNAVSILNRLRLNSHLDDAAIAAIWTDSTLDGRAASHPHLDVLRRVPDALRRCSRNGWTSFATMRRAGGRTLPGRASGRAARADLPPHRSSERPARVIAFPRFRAPLTSPHVARIPLDCCGRRGRPHRRGRRRAGDGSPAHRQRLSRRTSRRACRHRHSRLAIEPCRWQRSDSGEDEAFLSDARRLALPAVGSGAPRDRRVDAARRRHATVAVATSQPLIFRKGLDMKEAVAGELATAYHSAIVDRVRASDFQYECGRLTIHLAREFGFCYGVDRAVDYAYQARRRFPERNVFLTGEIIHNPHVNERLRAAGIRFLSDPGETADALGPEDVVILPAFGVTVTDMAQLSNQGCTLVDTTCGSVLNVWKNVVRYAQEGFTRSSTERSSTKRHARPRRRH